MRLLAALLLVATSAVAQCSYSAVYPGAVATDANLFVARDNVTTTLAVAMTAGDGVAFVTSSSGWAVNMIASIESEKMQVTAVATNALTVTRGIGQSTPASHAKAKAVSAFIDCDHHQTVTAEIKAIEATLGANLSNVKNAPRLNSASYIFGPFTSGSGVTVSGGNLAIGNNVLTFATVPAGVNGTDAGHRLYVSGGTGTAENCLISGGAGVAGQTNGQILVNCAGTHSGAWTIQSNWAGVSEAAQAACTAGTKAVAVPGGSLIAYGKLILPCSGLSIRGSGAYATLISMVSGYTDRAVEAIVGSLDFGDLAIFYTTAGTVNEALYVSGAGDALVSNLYLQNSYKGITSWNSARVLYRDNTMFTVNNGYTFGSDALLNTTPYVQGGVVAAGAAANGIVFTNNIVGGIILGVGISGSGAGIATTCSSGSMNEMDIAENIIDGIGTLGIDLNVSGTCSSSRWQINGNKIAVFGQDLRVTSPAKPQITALTVVGNQMLTDAVNAPNITIAGAQGVLIEQNLLTSAMGGGNGVSVQTAASDNVDIRGNNIGGDINWSSTPSSATGINIDAHAHTAISATGNSIWATSAAITNSGTVANSFYARNNRGVEDVIPAVASAATLAFPVNPIFTVTGSTNVTAATSVMAPGAAGRFTPTDATITFTKGATIGNSWVALLNVPVAWHWDGTKMWLGGGGPLTQFGKCTLGTNCAVTFPVAFTGSTTYQCGATDQTAAAAVKVVNTSASVATFTGTGTDVISYVCTGN